jgi:hypothetical protein
MLAILSHSEVMTMNKYFILLGAEVLAAAMVFFLVIAVIAVVNHDVGEFIFDLKTRLIGVALIIPFIKLISGYYLILWGYLRLTHQKMSHFSGRQYLAIIVIALMSVLILMVVDSIQYNGEFLTRLISLMQEFFLFKNPMAKFVYAGIVSCLIAPKLAGLMGLGKYQT